MATGLINNASASFNMSADAVTADTEVDIEALSFVLGNNGGREIHGQLFVTVPQDVTGLYTTVSAGLFSDGTIPVAYSDGATPVGYYTRTAAPAASATARVDFTATLQDQAFEEYDIFGGPRTQRSDRDNVRF